MNVQIFPQIKNYQNARTFAGAMKTPSSVHAATMTTYQVDMATLATNTRLQKWTKAKRTRWRAEFQGWAIPTLASILEHQKVTVQIPMTITVMGLQGMRMRMQMAFQLVKTVMMQILT